MLFPPPLPKLSSKFLSSNVSSFLLILITVAIVKYYNGRSTRDISYKALSQQLRRKNRMSRTQFARYLVHECHGVKSI